MLSCTHCNSRKLDADLERPYRRRYVWPHLHNPLLAFEVGLTGPAFGKVQVGRQVASHPEASAQAQNTIKLYALDQAATKAGSPDQRYTRRVQAIHMAITRKNELAQGRATVQAIVDTAKLSGFFSVWFAVFSDVPEVKAALITEADFHLPANCFDVQLDPVPRLRAGPF